MKKTIKKVFYPQIENNHRPYFWHPVSISFFVLAIIFLSGIILYKNTSIDDNSLLSDIKSGVVIAFTNNERKDVGLPELIENETLNQAALLKAQDMASKGYFAHYSPNGASPWSWFTQAGYQYQKAGENLAVNFKDSKTVVNAWMDSPTHKANIVKDGYTEIGIGIAEGEYKGKKALYVVQLFATPKIDTAASKLFAFSIEKKAEVTNDQISVRGAEITLVSLATIFEIFTTQTYSLVIILLLISLLIISAIVILLIKGKQHTRQFYISLFILVIALGISVSTLFNFLKDISFIF